MNITDSIAEQIGGDVEQIIRNNQCIQFYGNAEIEKYQWRDSRFYETGDPWENGNYETREEMINAFLAHIKLHYQQ